jgi:hypothetical protein
VLTVVQHDEQPLAGEILRQASDGGTVRTLAEAERGGDGGGQQLLVSQRSQLHHPDAVREGP